MSHQSVTQQGFTPLLARRIGMILCSDTHSFLPATDPLNATNILLSEQAKNLSRKPRSSHQSSQSQLHREPASRPNMRHSTIRRPDMSASTEPASLLAYRKAVVVREPFDAPRNAVATKTTSGGPPHEHQANTGNISNLQTINTASSASSVRSMRANEEAARHA